MKKIIIYAVTRSDNLGDNVIGETCYKLVKSKYPTYNVELRDLYHIPFIFKVLIKFFNVLHVNTAGLRTSIMRFTEFLSLKQQEHIVVFAGGQLFYETFIEQIWQIVTLAETKDINVHFYGCGTGYLSCDKFNKLVQLLSKPNVKSVCLRDDYIGLQSQVNKVRFVPDVAISCNKVFNRSNSRNVIGIGLISIDNYNKHNTKQLSKEEYYNGIIAVINKFLSKSYSIELFCNGNIADYNACKELYSYIVGNKLSIAPRPKTSAELVGIVTQYSHVIASRLHAMIISYSFKIPFYGLSWDSKIPSFCQNIHYTSYCGIESLSLYADTIPDYLFNSVYDEDLWAQLQIQVNNEIGNLIC